MGSRVILHRAVGWMRQKNTVILVTSQTHDGFQPMMHTFPLFDSFNLRSPGSISHNDALPICTQKIMLFRSYFHTPWPRCGALDTGHHIKPNCSWKTSCRPQSLSLWPSLPWFDQRPCRMKHACFQLIAAITATPESEFSQSCFHLKLNKRKVRLLFQKNIGLHSYGHFMVLAQQPRQPLPKSNYQVCPINLPSLMITVEIFCYLSSPFPPHINLTYI